MIPELAFVGRVSDTSAAKVTGQSLEKPRYPPPAMRTVNPRPIATEVTERPRDIDELRSDLVTQFDVDQAGIRTHSFDSGPPEGRPFNDPGTVQQTGTMKFTHVDTIDCQML